MTCHTCQQGIAVICDSLYGRRSFRCGCGTIGRREAPPPEPKGRRSNGFTVGGIFYGTCMHCKAEFERDYPRQTCFADACLQWLTTGRHGLNAISPRRKDGYPKSERPCRICGAVFLAWRGEVCPKVECQSARKLEYRPPKSPLGHGTCHQCRAEFVEPATRRGRPQKFCSAECRKTYHKRKAS